MSKRQARLKKDDDEESGADDWMMTYGDLMTQLVCFFVLLMSFSVTSSMDFRETTTSLHEALSGTGVFSAWRSAVEDSTPFEEQEEIEAVIEMQTALDMAIQKEGMADYAETVIRESGLAIVLKEGGAPVFFDTGYARIKKEAYRILDQIGKIMRGIPNHIRVEGHTDSIPIHTAQFPSNWELSTMRATNVLRHLQKAARLAPNRFSAVGYGPYKPIASNSTKAGRAKNRRVEVIILRRERIPNETQTKTDTSFSVMGELAE